MSTELDSVFSVLAAYYTPERLNSKPEDESVIARPEAEKDFFKQKFDLTDQDVEMIRSEIDKEESLNGKFDRLEELLEFLGFEKAKYHRDRGLTEVREDGDYGLRI